MGRNRCLSVAYGPFYFLRVWYSATFSLQNGTARAADISSDKSVSSIIYRLANPTADECFSPTAAVKALETAFAAAGVVSGAAQILLGGELIVGGGVITFGTAGAGGIVGVPAATIGTFYVVEGLLQGLSSYEKLLYVAKPISNLPTIKQLSPLVSAIL